jgi:hypothetical protein
MDRLVRRPIRGETARTRNTRHPSGFRQTLKCNRRGRSLGIGNRHGDDRSGREATSSRTELAAVPVPQGETGLLLDTFLVRTIMVPALAVLVGRANYISRPPHST